MTHDQLSAVLEAASAETDAEGWSRLPDGRAMALYASHDGVGLTVSRVEALLVKGATVRARTGKGEVYFLALDDVFAASTDGPVAAQRRAGFVG